MTDEGPLTTPSGRPLPPSIGGYRVIARLSRGGMGEVLLGQRESHGFEKKVAIKIVLPHVAEDEDYRTLFFDEARLVARMSHAHLTQVFDFGEDHGHLFLVMEYIEGLSVERIFHHHKKAGTCMPAELAGLIAAQAARGLHSAHTLADEDGELLGVVHRDVSPQNLIVTYSGTTKVLDFGIARSKVRKGQTQIGVVRGKPGYMAPEQAKNRPLDARTDIFQLGIVLYELLTTRELYLRENMYESIAAAVEEPVPDVRELLPGIDPGYQDVLGLALAKDPDQRFSTADAMARALDVVVARSGRPVTEALLGDHIRALRPPKKEDAPGTHVLTDPASAAAAAVAAGRVSGQSTAKIVGVDNAPTPLPRPATESGPPAVRMVSAPPAQPPVVETGIAVLVAERRRQRLVAVGLVGLLAIVVVAGLLALGGRSGEPAAEPTAPPAGVASAMDVPAEPALPSSSDDGGGGPFPDDGGEAAKHSERARLTPDRDHEAATGPGRRRGRARKNPTARAPAPRQEPAATSTEPSGDPPPTEPSGEPLPTEPAPAAPTFGTLMVISRPYAQVVVDGARRGDTPLDLKLPTGPHDIALVDPQSDQTWFQRRVVVKEGRNRPIRATQDGVAPEVE